MHLLPILLSAALALAPAPPAAQKAQPTPAPEKGSAHAGPAGNEVLWAHTFEEAVASAKKMPEGRLEIVPYARFCVPCTEKLGDEPTSNLNEGRPEAARGSHARRRERHPSGETSDLRRA